MQDLDKIRVPGGCTVNVYLGNLTVCRYGEVVSTCRSARRASRALLSVRLRWSYSRDTCGCSHVTTT